MVWNAPSDKKPNDQKTDDSTPQTPDPWTGRPKTSGPATDKNGPPLLDESLKKLFNYIRQIVKESKNPQKPDNSSLPPLSDYVSNVIGWCIILIVAFWFFMGLKQITNDEQGIVLRLGSYHGTLATGWHWRPWGLDRIIVFDRNKQYEESVVTDILSQDLNLAQVSVQLKYHINDPKDYLFNAHDPVSIIRAVMANSLLQTTAEQNLDSLFANNRDNIFLKSLQNNFTDNINAYNLGIKVDSIQLSGVAVPDAVKEIFNKIDALYAEQSKQKQQANDYEQQLLPPAQAKADQMIAEAKTYAAQAELKAQEDVADFLTELPAYQKAPALTKYRLYMQTMKQILIKTPKVVVDGKAGNPVINLPPSTKTTGNTAPAANIPANPDLAISNPTENIDSDGMYANIKGGY